MEADAKPWQDASVPSGMRKMPAHPRDTGMDGEMRETR